MIEFAGSRFGWWLVALSLVFLFSQCTESSLSSSVVTDPSLLQINLLIMRQDGNDVSRSATVEAYVRDRDGKPVANNSIQLKVNGTALRLNQGATNYYGAFPYYELKDSSIRIAGNQDYIVTVVMSNGRTFELGRIRTQPDLTADHLAIPLTHQRNQPLTIQWNNVEPHNYLVNLWHQCLGEGSTSELKIFKIREKKDPHGNVVQEERSVAETDYLNQRLGSGKGNFVLPKSYLEGNDTDVNALGVSVSSTETVKADEPFLPGSTITSQREGLYRIDVTN